MFLPAPRYLAGLQHGFAFFRRGEGGHFRRFWTIFEGGGRSESGVSIESPFSSPSFPWTRERDGHLVDNSKKVAVLRWWVGDGVKNSKMALKLCRFTLLSNISGP